MQAARPGERWEFADEVMDLVGDGKPHTSFRRALNEYLEKCQVSNRVPSIKELRQRDDLKGPDAIQAQAKAFREAMNALFEAIHEEPQKVDLVVPARHVQKREMERVNALMEKHGAGDNGDIPPEGPYVAPPPPVQYDGSHEAFLARPDLLDALVTWGEGQVQGFSDAWRAIFLALASLFAPPIHQGAQVHRPMCDCLFVGEISTAKSALLKLAVAIAPKGFYKTAFTPVAFSGRYDAKGNLVPGIAARADGGLLSVDEADKLLRRFPSLDGLFRSVQTEGHIDYETTYGPIDYPTSMLMFWGANPEGDIFSDTAIRGQIPFAEGILSRFAFMRPMAYTTARVNNVAAFMADTWFSEPADPGNLDAETIRSIYAALSGKLNDVKRVDVPRELLHELLEHFHQRQDELGSVPLLHTRDLASAMKWLNASAAMHVVQRPQVDGAIKAEREDLENALYMLDAIIAARRVMLAEGRFHIAVGPLERARGIILTALERDSTVERKSLVAILMDAMGISQATAYRYISDLTLRDDVRVDGTRGATVSARASS